MKNENYDSEKGQDGQEEYRPEFDDLMEVNADILFDDTQTSMDAKFLKAVDSGKVAAAARAIENGADVNARSEDIESVPALNIAINNGDTAMAGFLLTMGADPNQKDANGENALISLAQSQIGDDALAKRTVSATKEPFAGFEQYGSGMITPLMFAAQNENIGLIRALGSAYILAADGESEINAKDGNGDTAMHYAAGEGHITGARMIMAAGADINAANNKGETPLVYAALYDAFEDPNRDGSFPTATAYIDMDADIKAAYIYMKKLSGDEEEEAAEYLRRRLVQQIA